VTGQTRWTVEASAAPTTVAEAFGTRPRLGADPTARRYRAATGSLPDLPDALDGMVTAVLPAGGPKVLQPQATQADPAPVTGADVRNADTPPGVTPSTGRHDAGLTIATLQFAHFKPTDLTTYAEQNRLPDPVAAGRLRQIQVDRGPSAADDAQGGAIEASLDQEALLSAAPTATQAVYLAPNSDSGFVDGFAAVYDDVTRDVWAAAPDAHIAALSVSWGVCEAMEGRSFIQQGLEPVIDSLVAAGVTVFAASGDDGIYGCGTATGTGLDDDQADVDYPASSPHVVAVGGTRLTGDGTPNDGSNWQETGWSCTDPSSCEDERSGTGGSGGGVSGSAYGKTLVTAGGAAYGDFAGFAEPAYQRSAVKGTPYASITKRMVPDISTDGDPASGFAVYCSVLTCRQQAKGARWAVIGGTSLASPLSAAQLVDTLGDAGVTGGVGDIHQALYSAYTKTKALAPGSPGEVFRDVTDGTNGDPANAGADPSVSAGPGYDTVSGLGGVLWPALTPYLLGSGTPTAAVSLTADRKDSTRRRGAVRVQWTSGRGKDTLRLRGTTLVVRAGGKQVLRSTAGHGSKLVTVRPGARLTAVVTATDIAGRHVTRTARRPAPRVRR